MAFYRADAMGENKADETWVSIPEDEQTAAGLNFGDKTIRRGFIRKVYSILSLQLIVTGGIIVYFVLLLPQHYHDPQCHETEIEDYENGDYHYDQLGDKNHSVPSRDEYRNLQERCDKVRFAVSHMWMMWGSAGLAVVVMIPMVCVKTLRVQVPINFILLGLFTLFEGVSLGMISMLYDVDAVVIAAGITTGIVLALTVFAFQTKWDFTAMGGILVCVLFGLVIFGFVMIFVPYNKYLQMVYGGAGALIFSLYLVYDTQMMLGGDHKYSISPEDPGSVSRHHQHFPLRAQTGRLGKEQLNTLLSQCLFRFIGLTIKIFISPYKSDVNVNILPTSLLFYLSTYLKMHLSTLACTLVDDKVEGQGHPSKLVQLKTVTVRVRWRVIRSTYASSYTG